MGWYNGLHSNPIQHRCRQPGPVAQMLQRPAMGNMLPCKRRPAHVGLRGSLDPMACNTCPTVTPAGEADCRKARNDGMLRPWCAGALAHVPRPLPRTGRTSHEPLQVRLFEQLAQG